MRPEGDEFWDSEDITTFATESGETIVYENGEFYLDVSSTNVEWVIEVFDYR